MARALLDGRPIPPPEHAFRTVKCPAAKWFRVHRHDPASGNYGATEFNSSGLGNARFSPLLDPATGRVIPTLYAAQTTRGAIAEIVLHEAPNPSSGYLHDWEKDKASDLRLSAVALEELVLANLTTTGLQAAGLHLADLFASDAPDYARTRCWALWIWQHLPAAQGLQWMSRRDNASLVLMLFGDRLDPSGLRASGDSSAIAQSENIVFELLDEMGAGVMPVI